ncbi:MAG: AEC family transporter [Solobacterium sp.]|nr:AEC family transporter [Solobacterium sp.]
MGITSLLIRQITVMFALIGVGFFLYRRRMLTDQGAKDMGNILLYLVFPAIILNNFCVEKTPEKVTEFVHSSLLSLICIILAVIISWIIYGKRDVVAAFSASFSNSGFIGLPIILAVLGPQSVFSISMLMALANIQLWTAGVYMMSGDLSLIKPQKLLKLPIVLAVIAGCLIFFLEIPVPSVVQSILTSVSGLNTPLAMIVTGIYLAQSDLLSMIRKKEIYMASLCRLIVIPVITAFVIRIIPLGSAVMKLAILIAVSCPTGTNTSILAQMYGKNYTEAAEIICVSTLLCVITLPVMVTIIQLIL